MEDQRVTEAVPKLRRKRRCFASAEGGNTTSTGVSTTEYASYNTTVTDQAGKQRVNMTDGLGRLHSVTETTSSGMQVITYCAYVRSQQTAG
jgi:hypothetical protein